ncbi:MAG: hypothetical protein ACK5XN_32870 [Bacteroidota bacterium]|jgi:hypothetical protein
MARASASRLASGAKSMASRVAGSKTGKSIGAYASAKPKRAAAIGYMGAAGVGGLMKRRGPGVSKKFANGKRSTSIYKY